MGKRVVKNKIHFSFFLLFIWFVFTNNIASFITFCMVVLTHEFGHFIVAKKLGYKLDNFVIAPYGVCLNYKEKYFAIKDEILIALAGPLINIILSILCISFWWIFPEFYNFSYNFVFHSLILGLFNLLPCYPLDGGRLFVGITSIYLPRKKAIKATLIINLIIALFLFILFFISCFINFNPSLCLTAIFMIFSILENKNECKYQTRNLFNKKIKNYSKPVFFVVKEDEILNNLIKHIELNKFTIFIVLFSNNKIKLLDEQAVKTLSLAYPPDKKLREVLG